MADLFDFGDPPPKPAPPPPARPIVEVPPQIAKPIPRPAAPPPPPAAPRLGLVASFSCHCGCQSEVREPCPQSIPCWGCKRPMHRWTPRHEPPLASAEVWDGEKLVRAR